MQRRRTTKPKQRYFRLSLSTSNLHSIPKLLTIITNGKTKLKKNNKNVKSNVLYSIPFYKLNSNSKLAKLASLVFLFGLISILYGLTYDSNECYAIISTSLSLSNNAMISDTVTPGEIATVNTDVTVNVTDAESYSLILSVKNTTMTNGTTTIAAGNPDDSNSSNVWGYKWDTESTYTAPTTTGTILTSSAAPSSSETELTSSGSTSFTKTLTFGAKFGEDANAGAYHGSGTISLTATPRVLTYTLTLDPNGGNGGTSSKACEVQDGSSCTINLSEGVTVPTKSSYTFVGWADSNDAGSAQYSITGANSTSKSITLNSDKTIYAVWQSPGASWTLPNGNTLSTGIEYMQDVDKSTILGGFCGTNVPIGSTITLADNRTYPNGLNNTYTIRKHEDGKCWMTQNLRLTSSASSGLLLTSEDSDVTTDHYLPENLYSNFTNYYTIRAALIGMDINNEMTGFYTWCAATVGCKPASGSYPKQGENIVGSICPKGWRLPTGGSNGEFLALISSIGVSNDADGSTKIRSAPYYFDYTGRVTYQGISAPGPYNAYGVWHTSTSSRSDQYTGDYALYVTSKVVETPGDYDFNSSYTGVAMRCIAR